MAYKALEYAKMSGTKNVLASLKGNARGRTVTARIHVGYHAPYAPYVHERMNARHPIGQAKFLETVIRTKQMDMARILTNTLKGRHPLDVALLKVGEWVKGESQKLCPVDTGFLRNSAFARIAP